MKTVQLTATFLTVLTLAVPVLVGEASPPTAGLYPPAMPGQPLGGAAEAFSCGSHPDAPHRMDGKATGSGPSANSGHLHGYWGSWPAQDESNTRIYRNRPMPLWEKTVFYPYRVVTFPFGLAARGLVGATVALYDAKVIRRVGRFFVGFEGPFGTRMNTHFTAGGLLGYGGGLTLAHSSFLGPENRFKLRWQSTTNESHKLTAGALLRLDRRDQVQIGMGYRVRPNARFFGMGPFASQKDESFFLQETSWIGLSWDRRLGSGFASEAAGLFSTVGNRGPEVDEDPPLEERFADSLPAGYGERSDGLTFSLALVHDNTSETGRPERGGVRQLKAAYFKATDDSDLGFWTYSADVQQFFRLWFGRRTLALRGHLSWLDGAGPIHFQRLMTNDDPDLLRGYRDFRWRARGLAAVTVEYRWPIWTLGMPRDAGLDAYLFTDVGQLFNDGDQLAMRNLTESYGAGVRVIGFGGAFAARLEIAWSDEDTVLRIRGDQLFQFAKGGLYHGRDPIPTR